MAPTPETTSVYECTCAENQSSALWKDDVTPAVFETSACLDNDRAVDMLSDRSSVMATCWLEGATKMANLLKESWRNPRYFRWVLTITTSLIFVNVFGFFNSFGPLYLCLRRDLHSTAVQTGVYCRRSSYFM